MRNLSRLRTAAIVLCLLLMGCGSSDNPVFNPTSSALPGRPQLFGYVVLDGPREQVQLEAFAPGETTPLWTGQAGGGGAFVIPTSAVPGEFRLRATPAGEDPLLLDVRVPNSPNTPMLLCPNYITSIAAYYRDGHPEVSLEEVKQPVRAALSIPADRNTNLIADGPQSPFSHSWFRRQAANVGGVRTLEQQVARQADSQVRSFRNPTFYPTLRRSLVPGAPDIQDSAVSLQEGELLNSLWDDVTSNMLTNRSTWPRATSWAGYAGCAVGTWAPPGRWPRSRWS